MLEVIEGHLYDHPSYYDLIFGSDWKAEFDFLRGCFARHARRPVKRVFEPACGTGRLLVPLAEAGHDVSGNDLNAKAVEFCNARFARRGLPPPAVVGDMANFRLKRPVDAAFNMINSVRHLATEELAAAHLACMARAVAKGGLYLLGLHLTPRGRAVCEEESWSARRGNLAVMSRMWSIEVDRRHRRERVGMTFDVYTPKRQFQLREEIAFRTYTLEQIRALLAGERGFEIVETYDFAYDLKKPIALGHSTEDVVFVLRRG